MGQILDFLAEKEILFLCSIAALIVVIFIVLFIQDMYSKAKTKSKLKQNTQELKNLTKQVEQAVQNETRVEKNIPVVVPKEPLKMPIKEESVLNEALLEANKQNSVVKEEVKQEKKEEDKKVVPFSSVNSPYKSQEPIVYKEEVYTKQEAKQELERITQELMKEEDNKIELTEFEAKQEENAIISLEELFEKGKKLILENDEVQYQDEGNEPISLEDLEKRMQAQEFDKKEEQVEPVPIKETKLDDMNTVSINKPVEAYQNTHKYTPTPVISPVFGLEPTSKDYHEEALRLENTANFEKLDDEIRKTNEFLAVLKELEKKLD